MDSIEISEFLERSTECPIIDVRSPSEYRKGHIPGAVNIPLFSDAERAKVGTLYKRVGQEQAITLGHKLADPKVEFFLEQVSQLDVDKGVLVHCWRGGMRSAKFAALLRKEGYVAHALREGYKAFRNFLLNSFEGTVDLYVLGGKTGSGKTDMLKAMRQLGEQVVDLEAIANHKGSAFGALGQNQQPSVEQFENDLYWQWRNLDLNKRIWVEDESHHIGSVLIPMGLFSQMREARVVFVEVPTEIRAQRLVREYAHFDKEKLAYAIGKIRKRLGDQNTTEALRALEEGDFGKVALTTLRYYDKSYERGLFKRDPGQVSMLEFNEDNPMRNAQEILKEVKHNRRLERQTEQQVVDAAHIKLTIGN